MVLLFTDLMSFMPLPSVFSISQGLSSHMPKCLKMAVLECRNSTLSKWLLLFARSICCIHSTHSKLSTIQIRWIFTFLSAIPSLGFHSFIYLNNIGPFVQSVPLSHQPSSGWSHPVCLFVCFVVCCHVLFLLPHCCPINHRPAGSMQLIFLLLSFSSTILFVWTTDKWGAMAIDNTMIYYSVTDVNLVI